MSKKRLAWILGIALVVVLAGGGGFLAMKKGSANADAAAADSTGADSLTAKGKNGKDEPKEIVVPVELAVAAPRDLPAYFQATGSLEAKRQVDLIAKAQGQVTKLNVEEGDFVRAGQVLLELDPREEQILLEQARVNVDNLQKEWDRISSMSEKGLAADRDIEAARKSLDLAVYERDLAEVRLDNRVIRAPFQGQVTVRRVDLGQTVNPGTPVLGLADVSPLEVLLYLPEQIVRDLAVDQPVELRADVDPDVPLDGRVAMIAPVVDPATSTVKVTLRVDALAGAARVGSFVRARITTDVRESVVSVPKRALVAEAGATYLFVAEADTVRKVPVTTGYSDDTHIEIVDGVGTGEKIVSVGQGGLRTGSKIRDLEAERAKRDAGRGDPAESADTMAAADEKR